MTALAPTDLAADTIAFCRIIATLAPDPPRRTRTQPGPAQAAAAVTQPQPDPTRAAAARAARVEPDNWLRQRWAERESAAAQE